MKNIYNPLSWTFDTIISKASEIKLTDWRTLQEAMDEVWSPFQFIWDINLPADFPALWDVKNWRTYTIKTGVIDNDPTKTNTGQSFKIWDVVAWNWTNWTDITWDDVRGPAFATNENIAVFDWTTWKLIKDSTKTIITTLWTDDTTIPTSKAVKDITDTKQETLVNQTNIKSINWNSILWSWDLQIASWWWWYASDIYLTDLTSTTLWTYKQVSYTPDVLETQVDTIANSNEVLAATYIFDADLETTVINAWNWKFNAHLSVSSNVWVSTIRAEAFVREAGWNENVLFSMTSDEIDWTDFTQYEFSSTQPVFNVNTTDRLWTRIYVATTRNNNTTISYLVWDWRASYFQTPLSLRHSQLRNVKLAWNWVSQWHINDWTQTIYWAKTFDSWISATVNWVSLTTWWAATNFLNEQWDYVEAWGWPLKKTSPAMSSDTLVITDPDIKTDSWIIWNASSVPNWFIQTTTTNWTLTFTSTVAETCSFTYYILN